MVCSGCGASKVEYEDSKAAKKAMNNATNIFMESNIEEPNQKTDIKADGMVAGYMEESGIFHTKWTISIDGETWFYVKFVTDEPINDVEGVISATTYGYYDSNDKCLGYAQQQVLDNGVYGREYYMLYLDADGNPKDYYSDEDGYYLYDYDGNVIGEGDVESSWFGNDYDITITMKEDSKVQVDFMDKVVMYIRICDDLYEKYSD